MELCQLDRSYMYCLSNYNKALTQRNVLLKQMYDNKELEKTLYIWDEQLLNYGCEIIDKRKEFIKSIEKTAQRIHSELTNNEEELEIIYVPNVSSSGFSVDLAMNHDKDIAQRVTTVGPHRDDLEFRINKEDARKFGSQGQQRTVALTLKLAEIDIVKQAVSDNPILLLDDVLSELDRNRQNQLLGSIADIQTIVTCTGLEEFVSGRIKYDCIYHVEQGKVSRMK